MVTPTFKWDWDYLNYIQEHLDKVTSGEIDRLMIFLPPRHGKSEMVTVRYPVWRLEREPEMRVIVGAYNLDFATYFSRKAKRIADTRMELARDRQATVDWETIVGGGMRAAGVGSGITGRGGNLIVIDDPIKSRKEANSRAYREAIYNWYKDDLYTRLEPGGAIILIQTRWHEDDLGGRLLAEGGDEWTVISLPALAGDEDPLGRSPGAALCPERFDEDALARIKRNLGLSFFALYQQTPMPPSGDFFKRHWFEIVPVPPAPGRAWWVRYWDKASTKDDGDYTAGVLMALTKDTGEFFVVDVQRGQWESEARDAVIRQTLALDEQRYGANLMTWFEQEGGSSGKDAAKAQIKSFAGHRVFAEPISGKGDKATRAEPFQSQAMVRNVKLVSGAWNKAYLDELASFPFGTNDDQIDGSSGSFRRLARIQERENRKKKTETPATGKKMYVRS